MLPRQLLALCLHKGLAARIIAQQAAAAADCFYGLTESLKRDSCQALCATVPVCAVAGLPVMGSAAECQHDQVECCLSSPAMLSCQLVLPACSSAACVKELTVQQLGQEAVPAILSTCHRCTGASSGETWSDRLEVQPTCNVMMTLFFRAGEPKAGGMSALMHAKRPVMQELWQLHLLEVKGQ